MSLKFSLRQEVSEDVSAIAALHREAFGPATPVPTLVAGLRRLEAPLPTMSFVAIDRSERIIGHVMLSHAWLDAPHRLIDVLVLSPLGVLPQVQKRGVGTALLERAVAEAGRTTAPLLFLEGNPTFYGPRGFEGSKRYGIRRPSLRIPEAAAQIVRLASYGDGMTGTLAYRDVFWEHDCIGLR